MMALEATTVCVRTCIRPRSISKLISIFREGVSMAKESKQGSNEKKAKSVPLIVPAGGGGTAANPVWRRRADEGGGEEGMFRAEIGRASGGERVGRAV